MTIESRGSLHSVFLTTLLAFVSSGFVVLAGCRSKPQLTPQQVAGKQLYIIRCAHCHEYNDLNLKKAPPDLHGLFKHSKLPSGAPATDAEVERTILAGKGMMPSFAGRFTQEQMTDLLDYLHSGLR
ncbi:MAG TPA: cytochrome c [Terracidiphilus sp.]|nr:cytochrome c [Terracidiphilus sp.]